MSRVILCLVGLSLLFPSNTFASTPTIDKAQLVKMIDAETMNVSKQVTTLEEAVVDLGNQQSRSERSLNAQIKALEEEIVDTRRWQSRSGLFYTLLGGLLALVGSLVATWLSNRSHTKRQAEQWGKDEERQIDQWDKEDGRAFKASVEEIGTILNTVASLCIRGASLTEREADNRQLNYQIELARNRCKPGVLKTMLKDLSGAVIYANFYFEDSTPFDQTKAIMLWVEVTNGLKEINGEVFGEPIGTIDDYVEAAEIKDPMP